MLVTKTNYCSASSHCSNTKLARAQRKIRYFRSVQRRPVVDAGFRPGKTPQAVLRALHSRQLQLLQPSLKLRLRGKIKALRQAKVRLLQLLEATQSDREVTLDLELPWASLP